MIKWLLMLSKRLFKKPMFIIILILIPVLVASLGYVSKEKSGFVNVALAQYDNNNKISNEIISELIKDTRIINFEYYSTPEQAVEAVKTGDSEVAWVFHDDLERKTEEFATAYNGNNYFVDVYEREDNILLKICHEKLSGVVYKYCAKALYLDYIDRKVPQLEGISEDELLKEFNDYTTNDGLFEFAVAGSGEAADKGGDINYLVAPVRGLLSVLVIICGLAATMYYMKDQKKGTYTLILPHKKPIIEFMNQIIAVLTVSIAMLISLKVIGLTVSLGREILVTVMFAVSVALFCMLLRRLIKGINVFAAFIPLITVVIIAVCPVFFSLKLTRPLQMLLPATYYLNGVYNNLYLEYFVVYIVILFVLNVLIYFIDRKLGKE